MLSPVFISNDGLDTGHLNIEQVCYSDVPVIQIFVI